MIYVLMGLVSLVVSMFLTALTGSFLCGVVGGTASGVGIFVLWIIILAYREE